MIHSLNEIIGLPQTTSATELALASDKYCETLFDLAASGDAHARDELVETYAAYLVWAYGNRPAG